MRVRAWKGGTYGIRVGKENAQLYFPKGWKSIQVEIDGRLHQFNLTLTFWTTCPEFRGAAIARWLERKGHLSWGKGSPPEFELQQVKGSHFRLLG